MKGGPSFHFIDKELINNGSIQAGNLYTIRKGELAHDNVKGGLIHVPSDIIKIRGKNNSWSCFFYDLNENSCGIYNNRPVECRLLECRNTDAIKEIYSQERLTRKDLLSEVEGLWSLIDDHQNRCSYDKLKSLVHELKERNNTEALNKIIDIIKYDLNLRTVVVEKSGIDSLITDFLFGRPLIETIKMFDLKVQPLLNDNKDFTLVPYGC
jgi:Fe-S-cluster containining protein